LREAAGRSAEPFTVTVMAEVTSRDELERWREAGVGRLIVAPWRRSPDALDGLRAFAARVLA
jgi:hypothetical protein